MLKKQLLSFLSKRLYLFTGGNLYKIENNQPRKVDLSNLKGIFFPVVIIGKEHYLETEKRYPVTNIKDLKDILKYQNVKVSLSGNATVLDDYTLLTQIELDETAHQFISSTSWLFWLPESWVLNLEANQLYQFIRGDHQMLALKTSTKTMLTPMTGPFKSKNYFLMSVGASGTVSENHLSEVEYISLLLDGLKDVKRSTWINLLLGQNYRSRLAKGVDWRALIAGVLVGIIAWQASYWAYLSYSLEHLNDSISEQNVSEVIKLQNKFENSVSALQAMQQGGFDKSKVFNIWDLTLTLMENNTNVLRLVTVGDEYELYLEALSSTETLEMLRGLKSVLSANFSTPIRQSIGQERFGIKIKLISTSQEEQS